MVPKYSIARRRLEFTIFRMPFYGHSEELTLMTFGIFSWTGLLMALIPVIPGLLSEGWKKTQGEYHMERVGYDEVF